MTTVTIDLPDTVFSALRLAPNEFVREMRMRRILADAVGLRCYRALLWIERFGRSEKGVITVEWVALAACMVVGAVAISFMVMNSLAATATCIGNQLSGTACP